MIELLEFFARHQGIMVIAAALIFVTLLLTYMAIITCSRHFWMYMACRKAKDHVFVAQVKELFKDDTV